MASQVEDLYSPDWHKDDNPLIKEREKMRCKYLANGAAKSSN